MRIEISADYTSAWDDRGEVMWMANTTTVAMGLMNQQAAPQGLLQPAVRWVGPAGRAWAWERPPRKLQLMHMVAGKKKGIILWLPWTVEVLDVRSGELFVFARNSPLSSMDDGLCILPLPGIKGDGRVPLPKLGLEGGAETMIAQAKHAFDQVVWVGETPEEHLPTTWRRGNLWDQWTTLDLLTVTSTDWQLSRTFGELTKPYEQLETPSLYEIFEKAAGQRK